MSGGGPAKGTFNTAVLFSVLLGVNALQAGSAVFSPFARRRVRAFNRFIAKHYWGLCVAMSKAINDFQVVQSGDPLPHGESVLVITNHQTMTDVGVLFYVAQDCGRLGDMKWFVKYPLKWVPGIGWGMQFLDCVFVKRDWHADRGRIERAFRNLKDARQPFWLVSFSEGTRITPKKAEESRSFAVKVGRPPLEHVMTPRTKGFVATVAALRDHVDAVYDVTCGYPGTPPELWAFFQGLGAGASAHVRRHPIADLPRDDDELAEWLHARFVEKDRLMAYYRTHGKFPVDA